MQITLLTLRYS